MEQEKTLVKKNVKKRSMHRRGSRLDLPEGLDRVKYGYRWLSVNNIELRSDGYDPRGYETYKNKNGKIVRCGDLVLGFMEKEECEFRKQERAELARGTTRNFLESHKVADERLAHEAKQYGGKIKFEYSEE